MAKCYLNDNPVRDAEVCHALEKLAHEGKVKAVSAKQIFGDSYHLSRESAVKLFNLSNDNPRKTTWNDLAALNRTLYKSDRLKSNEFWALARWFATPQQGWENYAPYIAQTNSFFPFTTVTETTRTNFSSLLVDAKHASRERPVVVYVAAKWCGPCVAGVEAEMTRLALRYPQVKMYYADVTKKTDGARRLMSQLKDRGVPRVLLFKDGKLVASRQPYSLEASAEFQELIGNPLARMRAKAQADALTVLGDDWRKDIRKTHIYELLNLPIDHPLHGVMGEELAHAALRLKTDDKGAAAQLDYHFDSAEHFSKLFDNNEKLRKIRKELGKRLFAFKSPRAFQHLADIAEAQTSIRTTGHAGFLVPGSGFHVTPLVTAMQLMDREIIDSAHYVYTEIKPEYVYDFIDALKVWAHAKPHMLFPEIVDVRDGEYGGRVTTIKIAWYGKPITIDFKINDSPEGRYFAPEDARLADVIVYHDVGNYGGVEDDLLQLSNAFAAAMGESGYEDGMRPAKKRVLSIAKFRNYAWPFVGGELEGLYGCSDTIRIDHLHDSADLLEVGTGRNPGIWISLDPKNQPLLAACRSREELEHLVDMQIATKRIDESAFGDGKYRFNITRKDDGTFSYITAEHYARLLQFGLELYRRYNPASWSARKILNMSARMLIFARNSEARNQKDIRPWAERELSFLYYNAYFASEFRHAYARARRDLRHHLLPPDMKFAVPRMKR